MCLSVSAIKLHNKFNNQKLILHLSMAPHKKKIRKKNQQIKFHGLQIWREMNFWLFISFILSRGAFFLKLFVK